MPDIKPMLWRLLAITGSVLLTLVLFIGIGLLIGLSIANRELTKVGVEDWSISIGSLSKERVVIEQLSVTMNELPSSSTSNSAASPLTIKKLLNTPVPSWLPETVILNKVTLKGEFFRQYSPLQGEVTLNTKRPNLSLSLSHPEALAIHLSRDNSILSVDIEHNLGHFNANYELISGEWNIEGSAKVPTERLAQASEFVENESIALLLNAQGSLSPETELADAEGLINATSGKFILQLQKPVNVAASGVTSAADGNIRFNVKSGVIESYDLSLSGDLTQWPTLPLEISTVKWQLTSQDSLALEPLSYQQILNKTAWPVQLSAALDGKDVSRARVTMAGHFVQNDAQFVRLELPKTNLSADRIVVHNIDAISPLKLNTLSDLALNADITLKSDKLMISSKPPSSFFAESEFANADFLIPTFFAEIPFTAPETATANLTTEVNNVAIKVAGFQSLKPQLSHNIHYKNGRVDAEGTIELAQGAAFNHSSTLTEDLRLTSNIDINIHDLAQADLQAQLSPLIQDTLPLLTLNKGTATAGFRLSGNLETGKWSIDEGDANLQSIDAIYDTTSVANANLSTQFNTTPERLSFQQASLSVGSIQQGFTIGPVEAELAGVIPFKNLRNSTVQLNSHSIKALGGSVRIPEQTYKFVNEIRIPIVFERINLGELMRQYPSNRIAIDGEISGTIPLVWDSQQLTVEKGYLSAVAPGGHLQVDSSALRSAVGSNPNLKTLASVLEDFYYQELSSVVGYDKNGELTLELQLNGYNPAVENGRKVKLNVTLEEDLPALIKGIQLSNSVSDVIRKRIQQRVN